MKKNYFFSLLIIALLGSFQAISQVDVTFRLDMSSETISGNGVHIAGSLNGWNTTSTPLTQEGATSIYSVVIPLTSGWYEYKFLNGDAWGTDEAPGAPCAASNGNRFVYINDSGSPVTLTPVPFGGCNEQSTGFSVTFNVDMSSESSISPNGVHLAGFLNGWSPDNFMVGDVSGNIHSQSIRLATPADYPITLEYKYLNGNAWGTEETPDASCATVVGTNRLVTIANSGENVYDVFNGCTYLGVDEAIFDDIRIVYIKDIGLKIRTTNSPNLGILNLVIYDISGREVKSTNLNITNESTLQLPGFATGIYVAQLSDNENHKQVQKFVIY